MAKFKVGDKVEDFQRYGIGEITQSHKEVFTVNFGEQSDRYTKDGKYLNCHDKRTLMLTGRPFNIGDRVVIGGENGVVVSKINSTILNAPPLLVKVDMGICYARITSDGRAWPGTPIIAEHDWEEEGATIDVSDYKSGVVVNSEIENHAADAIEYRERNKGVDISPGFAKDWPIDNGLDDITVSPEEVRHIAEMQGKALSGQAEIDILKEQYRYVRMALTLTGFKLDNEAAALITETVKKVLELGGEFSLKTACEVEARVNQMYEN